MFFPLLITGRSIHEALLTTVEDKHDEEMDLLLGLLEVAKTDKRADGKADEVKRYT